MGKWVLGGGNGVGLRYGGGEAIPDELVITVTEDLVSSYLYPPEAEVANELTDVLVDGPTTPEIVAGSPHLMLDATTRSPILTTGTFTTTTSPADDLPFADGILIASGLASTADGPNTIDDAGVDSLLTLNASGTQQIPAESGYAPLEDILFEETGQTLDTFHATRLTFSVEMTTAGRLSLDYFFASEEYPEYVPREFDDILAFFVDGTEPIDNIARVPGTWERVSVRSINGGYEEQPAYNEQYFEPNYLDWPNPSPYDLQYDGLTTALTAVTPLLQPGTHSFEIVIADSYKITEGLDSEWDSAVFLRKGGLQFVQNITSAANGDWGAPATWNPQQSPNDGYAAIVSGDKVTVTNAAPADLGYALDIQNNGQVVVEAAAQLIVQQELWVTAGRLAVQGPRAATDPTPVSIGGELVVADEVEIEIGATPPTAGYVSAYRPITLSQGSTLDLMPTGLSHFVPGEYTLIQGSGLDAQTNAFETVEGLGDYVSADAGSERDADGLTYSEDGVTITIDYDLHPGDADLNTTTDVRDFNIWNVNKFTTDTNWKTADFDGTRSTDVRDFNIWNTHKFTSVQAAGSGDPGGGNGKPKTSSIELIYNSANGRMMLDVDGDTFTSLIIDGPMALSIDRWGNEWFEDGNTWSQAYFAGAEQWFAGLDATVPSGVYHIATYPSYLTELDFGQVEYGTIDGGVYTTAVQFHGPSGAPVPEPGMLLLMLAGCAAAVATRRCQKCGTQAREEVSP